MSQQCGSECMQLSASVATPDNWLSYLYISAPHTHSAAVVLTPVVSYVI